MDQVKKKFAQLKLELDEAREEVDSLKADKKESDDKADAVRDS